MADWIYVTEALTDGDYGFPLDRIAEIGICRADLESGAVESMYCSRVRLEEGSFTAKQKEFLKERHNLTPEDLKDAPDEFTVIGEVSDILAGNTVTSFNISVPINRFLAFEPWGLTHEMTVMSSVSSGLPDTAKGDRPNDNRASIDFAYKCVFPGDEPAAGEGGTALDLALRTAYIMLKIRNV